MFLREFNYWAFFHKWYIGNVQRVWPASELVDSDKKSNRYLQSLQGAVLKFEI